MTIEQFVGSALDHLPGTAWEVFQAVRNEAQSRLDELKAERVEELRAVADAGRNAEAELAELGAPGRPIKKIRKPRTRKPKRSDGPPAGTTFGEMFEEAGIQSDVGRGH